jgi:NAD(P)-dependent dehydrogenase (short-subunit alcohol dehydrogenase family)
VDLQLSGKRAVVTGASRGIGRAIADRLAAEGCEVVVVAQDPARLERAAAEIAAASGRAVHAVTADTSDDESVAAMVTAATEALGGIDILVNSAARSAGATGSVREVPAAKLLTELNVKAVGYLRCSQQAAPHMIENGWGRIINVAGLAARQTGALSATMRNVAVAALTKNLADELGPFGINVTALHPGTTRTERIADQIASRAAARSLTEAEVAAELGAPYALGRIVEPAEIAYVAAFLASPLSVAINGDAIACGGGRLGSVYY